jgi:hypothetical protein
MMARLPKAMIPLVPAFIKPGEAGFFLGALGDREGPDTSGQMPCR